MDVFTFLETCRNINLDAASFHVRNLGETTIEHLKRVRRKYFDLGLAPGAIGVTTDFGLSREKLPEELEKAREGIRVAMFLGAPTVRVFAGSAPEESQREEAFKRAVEGLQRVAEEGAKSGLPVSLQNHNHRALARTGQDVLRLLREVGHPNLALILDTGQFAGSKGASEEKLPGLKEDNFYQSIQEVAPLLAMCERRSMSWIPPGVTNGLITIESLISCAVCITTGLSTSSMKERQTNS